MNAAFLRVVAAGLLVGSAACGTVSYPVKPYPLAKPFYDLKEEERYAAFCINQMYLAGSELQLGYQGKRYKSTEEMPLDREPSKIRNGIVWPLLIADYVIVLGSAGYVTYNALTHNEWGKSNPKELWTSVGLLVGSGALAALLASNLDTVAPVGKYNEQAARDHGIAPERQPLAMCRQLEAAGKMDVLFQHYKLNLAPQAPKAPEAPAPAPTPAPGG